MKIGINGNKFVATGDVGLLARHAGEAAAAGVDAYWLAQHPAGSLDALTALAILGRDVPDLGLGVGVVPVWGKHPAALAATALTAAQGCPGGLTVGIGLSLALAADIVVAKEPAYFLLAFVNIGLVPDGGSSLFVPERVGFTRAIEMAMLGERVGAPRALEWGLINRVVADDDFQPEVDALVDRLAAGPTASYAGTKRQLNRWVFERMESQLELEASIQQEMAESADFAEGVLAFLQKRQAEFKGA